jgi:catechol 2,3-dioxygenase-like lactoylglutathione lyase family enzyme
MFDTTRAFSGFAVDDIDAARRFYGDTLRLDVRDAPIGLLALHLASGATILIYGKPNTSRRRTRLNFPVDDIDAAVTELNERGVVTKIYTEPDFGTDARGISRGRGPDIAWFRDPAGNVLSVLVGTGP